MEDRKANLRLSMAVPLLLRGLANSGISAGRPRGYRMAYNDTEAGGQ